jgi:CRISPR system Cascade subunit CasE
MYLSRVQINPERRGGRRLLGWAQAMHAAVLSSFAEVGESRGRVLWRVDQDARHTWLYVLSQPRPDFAHIVEQAGWPTTQEGWTVRPYEPLLDRLAADQAWAFRLTANPTRTDSSKGGKRFGMVTVGYQEQWLVKRSEQLGFEISKKGEVLDLKIHDRKTERIKHGAEIVTLTKATFDGILRVQDATLLRAALVNGIGHGKAYGCGLLTLAPLG